MQLTSRIVELGRAVRAPDMLPAALTVAKQCVLDWLGVTLAGTREPAAQLVFEQLCALGETQPVSLLGRGTERASLLDAALFHGTASHALDYDDTHWGLQGHPTAPVLGALLGLAEQRDASGAAFLAAFVAGVEVECRLGVWLNPSHYARGFHATATLGTFGAAAAAAHLLDLSPAQWRHALGLAGTQAAGLKSAFGSMAKALQVGRAAQNGLLSAQLAAAGFTGPEHIFDDPQGFAATHAQWLPDALSLAPAQPHILDTLFKYHAACYLTHSSSDAVRGLVQQWQLVAADVRAIELCVDPVCLGVCNIERPRTGTEGKFSLKVAAALALLGADTADPDTFNDARMQDPVLQAVCERVQVVTAQQPATRAQVTLELQDGRRHSLTLDSGIPATDFAAQAERLTRKFAAVSGLGKRASSVAGQVLQLEQGSVRELLRLVL